MGLALVTAGLVVLLFVVYELVGTNLAEEHSQARLAKDFNAVVASVPARTDPSPTTTTTLAPLPKGTATRPDPKTGHKAGHKANDPPPGRTADPKPSTQALPVTPPGGALDHLVIPAIGVDRYVVEGVAEADLQEGPGHYPGTPLPGQVGNVAIAGHRTTFGAPFFRLNEVNTGDLVYLTDTLGTTWVYRVVSQFVVAPSDVAVLDATRTAELTLTTCNPRFEAVSRLVVRAVLLTHLVRGTRVPKPLPVEATKAGKFPAISGRSVALPATGPGSVAPAVRSSTVPTSAAPATPATSTTSPASSTSSTASTATTSAGGGGDSPVVGPSPGAASPSASSSGGGGTSGAPGGAVGWGVLALAGWVITRIVAGRTRRYTKLGVLAAGALVCLVPLWFSFGNVVNLLPSNI